MADAVATQVLRDDDRLYIAKFTNISDGTGEAAVVKIDVSALATYQGRACNRVQIVKVWFQTQGVGVDVLWHANTNVLALTIPENQTHTLDYSEFGGLTNNAGTGITGDVLFTTVGASANDRYTIVLECLKTYANA